MSISEQPAGAAHSAQLRVIDLATGEVAADPFESWIVEATLELLSALRDIVLPADEQPTRVAVVVTAPAQPDVWRAAAAEGLCEAIRGVVGALTLERGPSLRLNAVLTGDRDGAEVQHALAFLRSAEAGFVAGSTFDLRGAS